MLSESSVWSQWDLGFREHKPDRQIKPTEMKKPDKAPRTQSMKCRPDDEMSNSVLIGGLPGCQVCSVGIQSVCCFLFLQRVGYNGLGVDDSWAGLLSWVSWRVDGDGWGGSVLITVQNQLQKRREMNREQQTELNSNRTASWQTGKQSVSTELGISSSDRTPSWTD